MRHAGIIKNTFDDLQKVDGKIKEETKIAMKKGVRSRVRSFPSMASSDGLLRTLTFYMSKSDPKTFESIINDFRNPDNALSVAESITLNDLESKTEKVSYSIALACYVSAIEHIGRKLGRGEFRTTSNFCGLLDLLEEILMWDGTSRSILEKMVIEYSIELKKLVEAYIKEDDNSEQQA
ncbi:hypothetical protein IPA_01615 [Ignicoccus pacificus DSM 13166]|uniref:CRISPR type III-B/RAMP module-associated protein Cmr5 n=1 Tax=Ignicoccus pacificus DSM 13166 TaxID=940294 RepID=A0A977PL39_9CREN|nr:hypothetical protein IPA_01615 [Ignicoccus pacificus DSM 13166]